MKFGSFGGWWRDEAGREFIVLGAAHTHAICCISYVMLRLAMGTWLGDRGHPSRCCPWKEPPGSSRPFRMH